MIIAHGGGEPLMEDEGDLDMIACAVVWVLLMAFVYFPAVCGLEAIAVTVWPLTIMSCFQYGSGLTRAGTVVLWTGSILGWGSFLCTVAVLKFCPWGSPTIERVYLAHCGLGALVFVVLILMVGNQEEARA